MSEDFEKTAIDYLSVEITRKCQLKCAHCMKGEAQNIDMSVEVIDKLLESVVSIGTLLFTGGEPTMNLQGMKYFLDVIKSKGISLNKLQIITNGCETSEDVIALIQDYYNYITYDKTYGKHMIMVEISNDVYHEKCDATPKKGYDFYKKKLEDYPKILIALYNFGNRPIAIGRAKQLPEAVADLYEGMPPRKVEILYKNSHNYCAARNCYELMNNTDAVIMCPIEVTVDGYVSHAFSSDERCGKAGVSIEKIGLLNAIREYNQEAEYCIACMIIENYVKQIRTQDEVSTRMLALLNGDLDDSIVNMAKVDMEEYYALSKDYAEGLPENENFDTIVREWRDEVGEYAVEKAIYTAKRIAKQQMRKNRKYRQEIRKAKQILGEYIPKPSDTAYYGAHGEEVFKNEEERQVREEHPEWEHKDCIRYVNSLKWVKYYSPEGKQPNILLYSKHLSILNNIINKYK